MSGTARAAPASTASAETAAPSAETSGTSPEAAAASPGTDETPEAVPDTEPTDVPAIIDAASEAWAGGNWGVVQRLLEPLVDQPDLLAAPHMRTRALLLLADATLNDVPTPDTAADRDERRQLAASYLDLQMDAQPDWRMPADIYTKDLFDLYVNVSVERSSDRLDACRADRIACRSDVRNEQGAYRKLAAEHAALQKAHEAQEIEVHDRVARSRVFAAIPFGAGHFYNGDRGLGAGFLSAEVALGVTGLSLLLYRVVGDGCRRNRGFQRGSLTCVNDDLDAIARRRKTEEVMGWMFLGSVIIDITLAQLRFKPVETVRKRRVPRSTLDGGEDASKIERPRKRGRDGKTQAVVRPTAGGTAHGASLGVSIQF